MWTNVAWIMVGVVVALFIGVFALKSYTDRQHAKAVKELDEAIEKYKKDNPHVVGNPMFEMLTRKLPK